MFEWSKKLAERIALSQCITGRELQAVELALRYWEIHEELLDESLGLNTFCDSKPKYDYDLQYQIHKNAHQKHNGKNIRNDILPSSDYYLSEDHCYQRLKSEFKKYGKLIFCVDFDDTLYDFHNLGRTYNSIIDLLKRWEKYSEVIIFTGNGTEKNDTIAEYLTNIGVKFKGINCDSSVSFGGRKVYANVYIDDRGGLPTAYRILLRLIDEIEKGEVTYDGI